MIIVLLLVFAAFGAVCGVFLSITGFVVTTMVIFVGLGVVGTVAGGAMTPGFLVAAFVAEQVGFFLAVVVLAVREAARRRKDADKIVVTAVSVEREPTR